MPSFSDLRTQLNQSGIQKTNSALYTVIDALLSQVEQSTQATSKDLAQKTTSLTALTNRTYLTAVQESPFLPFARELLAGTGISFNDGTPNQRTISASAGTGTGFAHTFLLMGA